MMQVIPNKLSFAYLAPNENNHTGGIAIYLNTPDKQRNTAFALALDPDVAAGLMNLLNNWIAPSLEHLLELE